VDNPNNTSILLRRTLTSDPKTPTKNGLKKTASLKKNSKKSSPTLDVKSSQGASEILPKSTETLFPQTST